MKKMITVLSILTAMAATTSMSAAAGGVLTCKGSVSVSEQGKSISAESVGDMLSNGVLRLEHRKAVPEREGDKVEFMEVTATSAGQLAELLGDRANELDSLVVKGPVDEKDFETMWRASFDGRLSAINLEGAQLKDGIVPESAFWHGDEQIDIEGGRVYIIQLRNIILPEGVSEIGEDAFAYVAKLENINLPSTLRILGESCFTDCYNLSTSPLTLPEGMESISERCFMSCRSLGEIILPESMRTIAADAFTGARITAVNFPRNLESIGGWAFHGCRLTEVILPDGCSLDAEGHQFDGNIELKKVSMPCAMNLIPKGCFDNCAMLEEVVMPASLVSIEAEAFNMCQSLRSVEFPDDLSAISVNAFAGCSSLEQVCLPAKVEALGYGCFSGLSGVKAIYSMAALPPECVINESNPGQTPFDNTSAHIPVYVPIGCGDAYRAAFGWSRFDNIVETDDFPQVGIDGVIGTEGYGDVIYDLSGCPVTETRRGGIYVKGGRKFIPAR